MKGPRASCEGYLTFRTSPYSPPPMIRSYSMLVGTCFYYYASQEDAEVMMRLKGEVDVIGAQEWDGKGNMHIYTNGFMFVTAQNKVFYAYADTPMDKEKWLRAMQTAVMTTVPVLSTLGISSLSNHHELMSPSSGTEIDVHARCAVCPHDDVAAALPKMRCGNCEDTFCDRHSLQRLPLPHKGYYYAMRVCDECYYAQLFVNYLKAMNQRLSSRTCVYPKPLNVNAPIELIMPMGPSHTPATTIALDLFKEGAITAEELEVLLLADKRYLDQTTEQPEIPLDLKILALHREFASKSFTVSRAIVLLHQNLESDPLLFKPILERLLSFSYDAKINQVEFYWPQIVHAYLNIPVFEFEKLFWMDELVLSICSRSIHLALLLIWQLRGALEDAMDPLATLRTQSTFARVARLMVEIEVHVIGSSRQEVLQQSSAKKILPILTEDQLALVHTLMDNMAAYRRDASPSTAPVANELDAQYADFSGFQQHLLKPKEKTILPPAPVVDWATGNAKPEPLRRRRTMSMAEKSVLATFYAEECAFVEQITDIAEKLRFVPMAERKPMLAKHLETFSLPPNAYIPLVKATDPFEQVVRLPPKEGTAFSTKARVPIMLIFEVVRGANSSLQITSPGSARPLLTPQASTIAAYEIDEEVRHLINRQSIDSGSSAPETPLTTTAAPTTPRPATSDDDDDDDDDAQHGIHPMPLGHSTTSNTSSGALEMDLSSMHISDEVMAMERDRKKDLEAAFGESWLSKRERIRLSSPHGHLPGWDIVSMIGKSNDDMRQEVFTLQLIQKFLDIFKAANLPIWLKVYRIIATSSSAGLVETLTNAMSLDGLKKRDGYVTLLHHFEKSYGASTTETFASAQAKFIQSMAGYSLVSYFLQIKDRHNGNIMLDNEGHIIHIDYGFLLGIAPGGSFSIETAPFKLTTEMVDTMGGPDSEGFKEYVTLCTRGFLALQPHCDELCDLVGIMAQHSPYPCFAGKDVAYVLSRFRSRFKVTMSKHEVVAHMLYLIRKSHGNYSTRQYDAFQRMTNGIYP